MLKAGIITAASSAWSFPVVIDTENDRKPRFCVDYRVLNRRITADRFTLPKIQEIFGGVFFMTLDLFFGYWQIRLSKRCKERTTVVCRMGIFQFEVMHSRLMNAPSTFQRMMNKVVGHLHFVRVYLNDVIIFSRSLTDHLGHIQQVLHLIAMNGLKVKMSKCEFAQRKIAWSCFE